MEILEEQKQKLLEEIHKLGYESLRYSIFPEEYPGEWEVVIEFNGKQQIYFVYGTMDRGSYNGKHAYPTFEEAKTAFMDFLADIIKINNYYTKEGMPVNYLHPLWSDDNIY
ncbi:Imm59 family immunity protein [Streptococcus suis]|nr:Imm59 family immunity protein [Streptococcus suis]